MKDGEHRQAPLVPIQRISTVPLYFFVAGEDLFCPAAQAIETAEAIGDTVREVRIFDRQGHEYFTMSLDTVLMRSLLHALGTVETPIKAGFQHHWRAWEENHFMGFAPFF